jgi:hypothetical protein
MTWRGLHLPFRAKNQRIVIPKRSEGSAFAVALASAVPEANTLLLSST